MRPEWEAMDLPELRGALRGMEEHALVCRGCRELHQLIRERLARLIDQRLKEIDD